MTTTINASTTAGLVQTADTSGVLALQTAGTTAVSISAAQVVSLTNGLAVTGAISSIGASGIYGIYRRDTSAYVGGWYAANSTISLDTASGAALNIYSTGGVQAINTISVGNTAPSTSGAGITFPATQSASTDANTLDDYEEGTWTPTDQSGAGLSFTSVTAIYTKVGRLVTCMFNIIYPTTASGSQVVIGGFPFTNTSVDALGGGCINYTNAAITNAYFSQAQGSTLNYAYTSSASPLSNATLSAKILRLTVTYMTS